MEAGTRGEPAEQIRREWESALGLNSQVPAEPQFPPSYDGFSQRIYCVLIADALIAKRDVKRHQQAAHPSELGIKFSHAASKPHPTS